MIDCHPQMAETSQVRLWEVMLRLCLGYAQVAMGKFPPSCEGAGLCATQVLKLERSHLGYFFRLSKKEETSCRKKLAVCTATLQTTLLGML